MHAHFESKRNHDFTRSGTPLVKVELLKNGLVRLTCRKTILTLRADEAGLYSAASSAA
jgi:hypothetical protein